jgi:hypothetical protein
MPVRTGAEAALVQPKIERDVGRGERGGRCQSDDEALRRARRDIDRGIGGAGHRVGGRIGRLIDEIGGRLVVGAIEQLVALPGPALMMVAKAVAADPTCTERLSGNTAELRLAELLVLLPWVNEALTDIADVIVTTHAPVPVQAPPQPAKLEPFVGVAVSVTRLPESKTASQNEELELQLMPGGELVTVPVPVPPIVTTSKKITGGAPLAASPGEGALRRQWSRLPRILSSSRWR